MRIVLLAAFGILNMHTDSTSQRGNCLECEEPLASDILEREPYCDELHDNSYYGVVGYPPAWGDVLAVLGVLGVFFGGLAVIGWILQP